jgi:hypothetical protein
LLKSLVVSCFAIFLAGVGTDSPARKQARDVVENLFLQCVNLVRMLAVPFALQSKGIDQLTPDFLENESEPFLVVLGVD